MRILAVPALAFTACVVTAALAGCGGSQPPIGASATYGIGSGSWTLSEAKSDDLLYAARPYDGYVSVFSYPVGRRVGKLNGIASPIGLCSDASGDIYVTSGHLPGAVYKYSHGGTSPIKTFSDGDAFPGGCSVDSISGDLAVTNHEASDGSGDVAVFQQSGSGNPKTYSFKGVASFLFCSYDDRGNLYASATLPQSERRLFQLPKGGRALRELKLPEAISPVSVQWVKNRLLIATGTANTGVASIYPVKISGQTGTVGNPILLQGASKESGLHQYWIQGTTIVGLTRVLGKGALRFWNYPQGGLPVKTVGSSGKAPFTGVTVSVGTH